MILKVCSLVKMHIASKLMKPINKIDDSRRQEFIKELDFFSQSSKRYAFKYGGRMLGVMLIGFSIIFVLANYQNDNNVVEWKKYVAIPVLIAVFFLFFWFYFQFDKKMKSIRLRCPVCQELLPWKNMSSRTIICLKCKTQLKDS